MKWRIISVGKPALRYAQLGTDEYLKRLRRHTRIDLNHLKAGPEPRLSAQLDEVAGEKSLRIVLDESGRTDLDTEGLAGWLNDVELHRALERNFGPHRRSRRSQRKDAELC